MRDAGHSTRTKRRAYRGRGRDRNFRKFSIRHPHTSSVASGRARGWDREILDVLTTEGTEELKGDFSWSLQKW
jgi:hypothetical protein